MATQFDNYFFNGGLEADASKAVAAAVAQAKAAGLPLDAAMNSDESPPEDASKGADEAAGKVSDEG
jgi:hypothetical protein